MYTVVDVDSGWTFGLYGDEKEAEQAVEYLHKNGYFGDLRVREIEQ